MRRSFFILNICIYSKVIGQIYINESIKTAEIETGNQRKLSFLVTLGNDILLFAIFICKRIFYETNFAYHTIDIRCSAFVRVFV